MKTAYAARWQLELRPTSDARISFFARAVAVVASLAAGALVLQLQGHAALDLLARAFNATLGTDYGRQQAAILATPIILTGLAAAVALRMRYWNVGAEGQLFIGAWAAAGVGLFFEGPDPIALVLMFVAGAVAGTAWMIIPALARAYANTSEIITTLLLTPVAILVVNHFSIGPWRDRTVGTLVSTYRIPYELPALPGGQLHLGVLVAVGIALVLAFVFGRTVWGYEVKLAGSNEAAGRFAGIRVERRTVVVLLLSGAIAGVAGMIELAGTAHRLSGSLSNGYGYVGLLVAVLCGASPLACIPVGFVFAVLLNAGIVLQTQGIPFNAVLALNGAILMAVAVGEIAARYRLVRVAPTPRATPVADARVPDA